MVTITPKEKHQPFLYHRGKSKLKPNQIQANWEAYIDKDTGGQTMNMFGYGDGGSGCTEEMIELMHRFSKVSVLPKCTHMGGAEFLEKNLKDNRNLETL
jgi:alpha-mannosidase